MMQTDVTYRYVCLYIYTHNAGTSKRVQAREEEPMQANRQPETVAGSVTACRAERAAACAGGDPGAVLGAVEAVPEHKRLERDVQRDTEPEPGDGAAGEVPVEEGDVGAADGDTAAEGGRAEAAEPVQRHAGADGEDDVGEEAERDVLQVEEVWASSFLQDQHRR